MLLDKKHSGHNSGVFLEDQSNIREVRKKTKYYRRFDSVLQVRMQYTTKKQVWFDHHVDYCSKILCIYIYMSYDFIWSALRNTQVRVASAGTFSSNHLTHQSSSRPWSRRCEEAKSKCKARSPCQKPRAMASKVDGSKHRHPKCS